MENYVANVIPHLQQWWPVIIRLAYLIGIVFAVVSLVQAVSRKQRFNRSTAIWSFIQSSEQALSYSPPSSPGSIYIQFAVYAIASIGVIGIARGLCLIRDTPNQSMNLSRGLVHLFGGILAVNLVTFLRGLGATVGGDVQTYIANIIG